MAPDSGEDTQGGEEFDPSGPADDGNPLGMAESELHTCVVDQAHTAHDVIAIHRGLEHGAGVSEFGCPMADLMHFDVIGMAVVAVPVVGDEQVGRLVAQDLREPLGGFVDVGLEERLGVGVLFPTSHAAVLVAEPHNAVDAEHRCRLRRLGLAALDQ